jgi:anti-sigma regulatory factor (Ser/Thr protein kinase)
MAAKTSSLKAAMEFVHGGALEANLPAARIGELDLLLEEIFMNVCYHAYPAGIDGSVTVTYAVPAPGELNVEVADQGMEFNPLAAVPPDLALDLESRAIGGLGIILVETLAKSLAYRRESGWNRLTFGMSAGS